MKMSVIDFFQFLRHKRRVNKKSKEKVKKKRSSKRRSLQQKKSRKRFRKKRSTDLARRNDRKGRKCIEENKGRQEKTEGLRTGELKKDMLFYLLREFSRSTGPIFKGIIDP